MKKLFLCVLVITISYQYGDPQKRENPLDKDFHIRIINSNLIRSPFAGKYVEDIKVAGECARDIIKSLHVLHTSKHKNDVLSLRDEILVKQPVIAKGILISDMDEGSLRKQVVELLKAQLLCPRADFFSLLHGFSPILKEPVKKSLSASIGVGVDNSILIRFMEVSASEATTYFDKEIGNDALKLKKICSEFTIFCNDLWRALSPQLKDERRKWLSEQAVGQEKNTEEAGIV